MKKACYLLLISFSLAAVSFTNPPGKLTGRWQPKMPPGMSAVTAFHPDNTFDIFINGKTFVSGQYWFRNDTLAISDPICGSGYYGLYRLTFMGDDSLRQTLLQDSCTVRRNSIARTPAMGRVKTTKP